MNPPDDMIVGIDLGTTFSLVAYADDAGPHVIRDENGEGRLPSVLGFAPGRDGAVQVTVGWAARASAVENARTTVYSIKRLIGKGPADIQRELPFLSYSVTPGQRDTLAVEIDGRKYTPQEISALILVELRRRAEAHLGRPVRRAVVTVPAYFDDAQRQATRDAAQIAGLEVVRIINEPTAAALAYGIGVRGPTPAAPEKDVAGRPGGILPLPMPRCSDGAVAGAPGPPGGAVTGSGQTVAVYDLGGGTFDVSILRLEDGVFQVMSTCGDTHLGGDDFDREIITRVQAEVLRDFGVKIDSPAARQALRTLAEAVKIRLGEQASAGLELDLGEGRVYRRSITRDELEGWVEPLVRRTLDACGQALRDAGLAAGDVEQIVLAGGSTRMPLVRRRVQQYFGRVPYTALDPDEVVALGAAIQAAVLSGRQPGTLLLDVIPLSLGIETMGGAMGKLILRNTTIPCRATEMFTTFVDGQTAIRISVLQGERELAADCRRLGEFELRGIPPMPAGIPKVEVAFLVDANGILNVSARETRSGCEASIQVLPSYGLTRAEADRLMRESQIHAAADLDAHRRIDLANQVEFDTHKAEQMLQRHGHLLDAGERQRIERDIATLRELARTERDLDALHRALDAFGRSTLRLAELGITEAIKGPAE